MTLTQILTDKTQDLKSEFIAKTEKYAAEYHALMVSRASFTNEDWANLLGFPTEIRNGHVTFVKGFYNTSDARTLANAQAEARRVSVKHSADFIAAEVKTAEAHYTQSIAKLAYRIEAKGLNQDALTVVSGRVGVNFETILTDGTKTVKAFTVIAEGPVQRPHYRYLIK